MIQSGAKKTVLCVSVEICSATFFLGPDPDLIVSNSIFADGAVGRDSPCGGPGRLSCCSVPVRAFEETPDGVTTNAFPAPTVPPQGASVAAVHRLRIGHTGRAIASSFATRSQGGRLRNVLTRNVPVIGARAVGPGGPAPPGSARPEAGRASTGGSFTPAARRCSTPSRGTSAWPPERLRFSYEIFRAYGNMSSPSVMFVLDRILREAKPEPGSRGLLLSFGAGFTAFAALIEFL